MNNSSNISLIAALSNQRVIGNNGQLPWRLPRDLQVFKRLTVGKPILMGRKTFESIGRPLPHRENIVLTRSPMDIPGIKVFHELPAALSAVSNASEVMIIGGGEIYRQCLPFANRLYLSIVDGDFEGDAFFPTLDSKDWVILDEEFHAADESNAHDFTVLKLGRGMGARDTLPRFLFE